MAALVKTLHPDWSPQQIRESAYGHAVVSGAITVGITSAFNGLALAFPKYYFFVGSLELNYRWADSSTRDAIFQTRFGFQPLPPSGLTPGPVIQETKIREEGGHTLFLSPGVQVSMGGGLNLELGMQIPIIKPDEGWVEDFVVHVGLMKQFF